MIGRVYSYDVVDSTNSVARKMAPELTNGDVIWALSQTGGYGKNRRNWHSPRGGLWFSVIFKPQSLPDDPNIYTKLASVAVVRVLKKSGISGAGVKWPNDIYHGKKKLGGILTEIFSRGTDHSIVIGIGLNVKNEIPEGLTKAVSLSGISETEFSVSGLLNSITGEITRLYNLVTSGKRNVVTNMWRHSMILKRGSAVRVIRHDGSSHVAKVCKVFSDSLIVEYENGKERIDPSEVEIL